MKKIKGFFSFLVNKFFALNSLGKIIVLIVIIAAGYFIYKNFAKKSSAPQYQTATAAKEDIISSISESGSVASSSQTNIGSPTNGVIQAVYVKNGDKVTPGQNLFKVKSTATPEEQSSAYASFLSAQNNLNSAKSKMNSLQAALFEANQTFINDKGISNPTDQDKQDPKYIEENANWLQAQADYNNQAGVIAAAQASYNNASLAYAATQDSIVTAPIAGTVANFSSEVGSNVTASGTTYNNSNSSSSSSNTSSTPILVLGDFSNLSITVPVSEVDISKIKAGQKATITLDAYPDLTFVGKVDSVDTIGTNSSGVVTFNAYISFVSPPPTIKPGMSATAVIQTARVDDALGVPTQAIQTASDGTSYVRVLKNGKISQVTVTAGLSSDTDTEITSGLNAGDTVVTSETSPSSTSVSTSASPFSSLGGGFGGGNQRFIGGGAGGGSARRTFTTGGGGR